MDKYFSIQDNQLVFVTKGFEGNAFFVISNIASNFKDGIIHSISSSSVGTEDDPEDLIIVNFSSELYELDMDEFLSILKERASEIGTYLTNLYIAEEEIVSGRYDNEN